MIDTKTEAMLMQLSRDSREALGDIYACVFAAIQERAKMRLYIRLESSSPHLAIREIFDEVFEQVVTLRNARDTLVRELYEAETK